MSQKLKNIIFTFISILSLARCKDPYTSPYVAPKTGYLVVEGYITPSSPRFTLSRTVPVSSYDSLVREYNAVLQVEGDDNSTYQLNDLGKGTYGADTITLNPAAKYRLRIHTAGNKDYLSDFVPYKNTPAIDSINWTQGNNGVDIYLNTHDPSNNTRFYQWYFTQTWHYQSARYSNAIFSKIKPWVVVRSQQDQIFDCWKNITSTSITLGNTTKLADDIVYREPLVHIDKDAQELNIKYSIIARQYALTEDAYNYLSLMQKNTESLGSIFDAQPSYLKGNIHNVNDAKEQVIGFISAGRAVEQRIYIDRSQLTIPWHYSFSCLLPDTLVAQDSTAIWTMFSNYVYIPIDMTFTPSGSMAWSANGSYCVDCRAQGGTNVRPSFWPN